MGVFFGLTGTAAPFLAISEIFRSKRSPCSLESSTAVVAETAARNIDSVKALKRHKFFFIMPHDRIWSAGLQATVDFSIEKFTSAGWFKKKNSGRRNRRRAVPLRGLAFRGRH
jgi:hypothetical protein